MEHIIQISEDYIVVIKNSEQALIDYPEFFKKVNQEIPNNAQFLIYNNDK